MRMENFMDYDYFIEYFSYENSIENCIDFAILFAFVRHFWYNNSMFRLSYIFAFILLLLVPIWTNAAEDIGVIGSNLGLDFYSRIDDAWDTLAQSILQRRLGEKRNYWALGCGANWLATEPIDQITLEELRVGNYGRLGIVMAQKKVNLTTDQLSKLSQCLVEKYNELNMRAHEDQNTLETVGNVGLYLDGDTANSDYDILADITRINTIIFKEKYPYTGTKNASARAIAGLLRGDPIAPLWPIVSGANTPSGTTLSGSTGPYATSGTTLSGSSTALSGSILPWALVCFPTWSTSSTSGGLFGDGFLDDINSTLAWWSSSIGRLAYTPPPGSDTSLSGGYQTTDTAFWLSQWSDFYNKPACTGIFCITIAMIAGNQSGLGGFSSVSIESLLEQHTQMMDPISWSDLSAQKMTNNSYQLPFLKIKFKDKIAWARVYISESPQITKKFKTEDSVASKDALFDRAFRCAMNEAWLPGDPILANGWIGAGYTDPRDTTTVANKTISLGPTETQSLQWCYQIRLGIGQKEAYQSLSTDLNEIQAFTQSMMNIILQILDTDRKLDTLPVK